MTGQTHSHTHEDGTTHTHGTPIPVGGVNHMQGPTTEGTVMADIGGDRGALVLITPPDLVGLEIEISPAGSTVRSHVYVRERRMGPERMFAAFYPSLPAGDHVIYGVDAEPASTVTIVGGEVATVDWRAAVAG